MACTKEFELGETKMRSSLRSSFAPFLLAGLLLAELFMAVPVKSQDYLSAGGKPFFATLDPVEQGYIDLSNGNLHLRISPGSPPQRSDHSAVYWYAYDSVRIWSIFCSIAGCRWAPSPALPAVGWNISPDGSGGGLGWIIHDFSGEKRKGALKD